MNKKQKPYFHAQSDEPASMIFGLQPNEIAELLNHAQKSFEAQQQEQRQAFRDEIHRWLPQSIQPKNSKPSHNVTVRNEGSSSTSPFVLDLKKIAQAKKQKELAKQFASQRFNVIASKLSATRQPPTANCQPPPANRHPLTANRQPPTTESPLAIIEEIELAAAIKSLSDDEVTSQFTVTKIFHLPYRWQRAVITFAMMALVVILPIKGFTYYQELTDSKDVIVQTSQKAYEEMTLAGKALLDQNTDLATDQFSSAQANFQAAQDDLNSLNVYTTAALKIIPITDKYLTDARRLAEAGKIAASLGQDLASVFDTFYKQEKNLSLTDKIIKLREAVDASLLPKIQTLNSNLSAIDKNILPEDKRDSFELLTKTMSRLETNLGTVDNLSYYLTDILGHQYKRRYLVVFQNNTEIRATGGFMGSLALVDIRNGKIENIEIPGGGTYDFQGSLLKQVKSPQPLQLINAKWELQDTNWFFDFPTSAQQIESFYENASGRSVDGVITINATLVEKLLSHTRPISVDQYGKTITAANFISETQKAVEFEYDKVENKPKQFIADLTPALLNQLFDSNKTDLLGIVNELKTGLKEKDILLYFNNEDWQTKISDFDWSGEVKDTDLDYLAVVDSNIAGGKTDTVVKQHIDHKIAINENGTIEDTVTITRKHTGVKGDLLTGVRNVNFMRLYVPAGAKLLSATGFNPPAAELFDIPDEGLGEDERLNTIENNKQIDPETSTFIYQAEGKTVFGNWTQTDPGETTTVTVKYLLPIKLSLPSLNKIQALITNKQPTKLFTVFYQKQPGRHGDTITSKIITPQRLELVWESSKNNQGTNSQDTAYLNFDQDLLHGVIFKSQ